MKLIFNNGTKKTLVNNPIEQKLYKSGEPTGWLFTLSISDVTSQEIDSILNDNANISKLVLVSGENEEKTTEIVGYEKVTSLSVRHTQTSAIADFQLTKGV